MRKFFMPVFTLLLLLLLTSPLPVQAAAKTNLVFIFDASGSMWGQIDGTPKIAIAKEAMDLIVNDLPPDMNVGLVAYGHRRKGDCDDVQTLIPLGPLDAKAFMAQVNALNPKGKTPMVRSIKKTADSIKHLEDETTILLVSDGEETCDPDPCGFVAELERLGIKFVLHVVGFDVGGKTEVQLKCMAKAGGGEYFPAKDAGKLKGALDTVIKKTVAKNLVVSAFDDKNAPVSARVNVLDTSGAVVATDAGRRISFGLAPGTYSITVKPETMSETKTVADIVVTEDKVTKRKVVFAKSQIIVTMKDGEGKPVNGYVRIVNTGTGQYADQGDHTGKTSGFIVSPGEYEVITECANTGAKVVSERFSLRAGENRNVNAICANARIGVFVINAAEQPVTGYIRIVDVPRDTYVEQEDSRSTMHFFEVPPGKYKVDVECSGGSRLRTMPFDIRAGQENRVTINCETKVIKTTLPKPTSGAATRETDENPREVALPQVADGPAGYGQKITTIDDNGAQGNPNQIGTRPNSVDYSGVGAQDTGGGLTEEDERPEQGHNPYAGMNQQEMQAAFAKDMGMQGPQGTGQAGGTREFTVGSPLDTKRHIKTLGYRLDSCEEKGRAMGRNDILNRVDTARRNLTALDAQLKQRVSKEVLQLGLDRCAQEVHAIQVSVAQGQ